MCTIVLASQVWPQWPLVVAANRDEMLLRPAQAPCVWPNPALKILAPRDLAAGGTWLGMNAAGLFVGITNRYDPDAVGARAPGSRGQLVLDALAESDAHAASVRIAAVDPAQQGPFHLLMADRDQAHLVWSDTRRMHQRALPAGVFVVTERSFGAAATTREPWLVEQLSAVADGPVPSVAQWQGWLGRHADDPFEGTCVHAAARGYGTRSSTLVRLGADGSTRLWHADGPPCRTPYVEQVGLVQALLDPV